VSDLNDRAAFEANTARIRAVTPTSERKWGMMTAQQMLCHLADGKDGGRDARRHQARGLRGGCGATAGGACAAVGTVGVAA